MSNCTSHFSRFRSVRSAIGLGPYSQVEGTSLVVSRIPDLVAGWINQGEYKNLSERTIQTRLYTMDKLCWWLEEEGHDMCGRSEIEAFMIYLSKGHSNSAGRWSADGTAPANGIKRGTDRPMRPSSRKTYYAYIKAFFSWCKRQGHLIASPFEWLDTPTIPKDQTQPYEGNEVEQVIKACRESRYPVRDMAIIMLLFDTGMRRSELSGLTMKDMDFNRQHLAVLGKGNKMREVKFGSNSANYLWAYFVARYGDGEKRSSVHWHNINADDPLFASEKSGRALYPSSITRIVSKVGRRTNIKNVRHSPHTLRHSFAIALFRLGADPIRVMDQLGHTSLTMTNRYLKRAQIDYDATHKKFSPGDAITRQKLK